MDKMTEINQNYIVLKDDKTTDPIKEIHMTQSLSYKVIIELLDNYPALERITCPISLYNRISKKYIGALDRMGVSIQAKYNYKHPKKYGEGIGSKVINLIQEGKTPLEVANIMNLPVEKVYYIRRKFSNPNIKLKTGKKTKYSEEQISSIKNQKENGVPVKEIAEKEDIPLRTVYYILKNFISKKKTIIDEL
ncbi:MAG: helix-turn-helix domain-containing protein [Methanobrevibacter sp. CfCl-M3]